MIVFSVLTMVIYSYQFFSTKLLEDYATHSAVIQWLNRDHYVGLQIYVYKNKAGEQVNDLRKMMLPYYAYLLICVIMIKHLNLHCCFLKQHLQERTDQKTTFLHQRRKNQVNE